MTIKVREIPLQAYMWIMPAVNRRGYILYFVIRLAEKVEIPFTVNTVYVLIFVFKVLMESIYAINHVATMPILRPCITMEKEEIIQIAQKIDTYETSILPYEDCCTVFVPKEPKTRPKIDACEKEEAKLDLPTLIASAVEQTERIIVYGKDKPERRNAGE